MLRKYLILSVALASVLFLPSFTANAAESLNITSVSQNIFSGKGIYAKGTALPGESVSVSLKDISENLIYSITVNADSQGNWQGNFDQPLKRGEYFIEAKTQDSSNVFSRSTRSETIKTAGPFAFIIGVFSALVAIFLVIFLTAWIFSKWAEANRYRRILMSQRDVVASYNVIKKDAERASVVLAGENFDQAKANELKFLVGRINENLEKMNTYVVKGVNIIGKYDIIRKFNKNLFKKNK